MMSFTERELATVLAALRAWQFDLPDDNTPIAMDHFGDGITPLTTDEIDTLCERLNFGG